jgi:hypothetical protein
MPLPTDEKLLDLNGKLLATFAQIFGEHPGIRPAHAKGTMLNGTFTPSAAAGELSIAQGTDRKWVSRNVAGQARLFCFRLACSQIRA